MTSFDVNALLRLPRVAELALSPDGRRLVTTVSVPGPGGKRFTSALWELDPDGRRDPRRLTRSSADERGPAFGPDGTLYFLSGRPDPDRADGDEPTGGGEPPAALWRLPPGPGEAEPVAAPPGGVQGYAVAGQAGTVVLGAALHAGAGSVEEDGRIERARRDAGVTARLVTGYPIRHWDRDLGPRHRHLAVADPSAPSHLRLLAGDVGAALEEVDLAVTADGALAVTGWRREQHDPLRARVDLVTVDLASGAAHTVCGDGRDYGSFAASPTRPEVACIRRDPGHPGRAPRLMLVLVDLRSGEQRELAGDLDGWPQHPVWTADGSAVLFTADAGGHTLAFLADRDTGAVRRLAGGATFVDLVSASPSGHVYALRSDVGRPPVAVALGNGEPQPLPTPGDHARPDGTVHRVVATAADGTRIGSWLVTPPAADDEHPAPLVVFVHGGPLMSWTDWHWRWNPHVLAAAGYAVLLPDPAPSTGYGQAFIQRGWSRWALATAGDLEAALDAAVARSDIDAGRVALAGGSYGGYMANWMAGHSNRFRAIVTHASIWSLRAFHGTADLGVSWEREFGDPYADPSRYETASPDRAVDRIRSPMLIIHGERDFRVPYSEALRLYTDLVRHGVEVHLLSFPDEGHWIQRPPHVRLWYGTVLAFLDHHLRGAPWQPPAMR